MQDSSEEIPLKRKKSDSKSKGSKKFKFNKSYFIDDAAESGDEEESQGDSDFEAEAEQAIKLRQELPERKHIYENISAEELAEKYEQKVAYQKANLVSKEVSVVSKQRELPSINDPKLWQVFCKSGKSKEVVINLLSKCLHQDTVQIYSAFASSFVNDCVYVEAYQKFDVVLAIKGMHGVYESRLSVVPISEMVDVFAMDNSCEIKYNIGEFVRIRSGKYKEDLAQVVVTEEHLGRATVRLVPRLEITGNKKTRPSAKTFNPNDYPAADKKRDPNSQEFFYSYQGNRFQNGLLYKSLSYKSIRPCESRPNLSEIKTFDDSKIALKIKPQQISFVQGDKVKVISGDSKGLTGSVESTHLSMVSIYPFIEELCDKKLEFPINELCKFFDIGDHVKVIEGRYIGVTGMVVSCEGEDVNIISDINKDIIALLANDLKLTEEIGSGQEKTENYNVNEIVQLETDMAFGIIIKIDTGGVNVLLNNNVTTTVSYHQITKKYSPYKITALDRDKNKICYNDMIKIVFTKHEYFGKYGCVKNGLKNTLFIQVKNHIDTEMISIKNSFCLLQGQSIIQVSNLRENYYGMIVRLKSGPYRGYSGKVVEVLESRFKLELSSISRVITIDSNACEKIESHSDVMALQEVNTHEARKTPNVNSPAYTPHSLASPWDVHETPNYSTRY